MQHDAGPTPGINRHLYHVLLSFPIGADLSHCSCSIAIKPTRVSLQSTGGLVMPVIYIYSLKPRARSKLTDSFYRPTYR